jgi:signal transduction histidine kinase
MKHFFAVVLCVAIVCMASCAKEDSYPSIIGISQEWLELKSDVINAQYATDFESRIEDFRRMLNKFTASPIGVLYRIYRPEYIQTLADMDTAAGQLGSALKKGGSQELLQTMLEIDTSIGQLQLIEKSLSDNSQLNYFRLFFFFSLFIIATVLVLWMLYGRLEKAEVREQQSLEFSRETIIAQEQERSRIARELHDTVAQDLWRLTFQTDGIDKAGESAERSKLCREVVEGQKEIMQRVRSICDNLFPPDFRNRSFGDTLNSLCYNFKQRTGIDCQLVIQDKLLPENLKGLLDLDTQLQCFRIIQECLANIEKHAGATETQVVAYSNNKGELVFCVEDNGKGFSPPDRETSRELRIQGHYGLWNIYERTALISGTLTFDSNAGKGTMVNLQIPIKKEKEQ